jgi:hypothetical protein
MTAKTSSSQRTFIREERALDQMPRTAGRAACTGNKAFDIFAETDKISQETRNQLSKVCAQCPLTDCGWRQTYRPIGYAGKVAQAEGWI